MNKKHDEVDLRELLKVIFKKKVFIICIAISFSILSFIYSFSTSVLYKSEALLMPVNQSDSLSAKLGSYSSLAGLAGVDIGSDTNNPTKEAIARINSYSFFVNHFLPYINFEDLVAAKKWSISNNTISYDKNIYDAKSKKWTRNVSFPREQKPSNQEAYEFYRKIMSISEDSKTSFVTLSIEHVSPVLAKNWVGLIVSNINERMRIENEIIAKQSIDFLNQSFQETSLTEIQGAISDLLQTQMKNLMLTSSNKNFVFKIIDAPISPERRSSPGKMTYILIGFFLGLFLSIGYVISIFLFKSPDR